MTEKEFLECIAAAVGDVDLADTDIPAIDLYLDQILSLMSEKNAASSQRYRERALTKTMINNYSKGGLISPIEGKKYSRAHIVEMLLVYALKNTLSIEEIKRVLIGVREDCGFSGEDMIASYHDFLSLKQSNRRRAGEIARSLLAEDQLATQSDRDFFLSLLDVLSLSAYLKAIGQEMLEARYEDLAQREEQERAEKREQKESDKAEKREQKENDKVEKREQKERGKAEKREKKERDKAEKREQKEREKGQE